MGHYSSLSPDRVNFVKLVFYSFFLVLFFFLLSFNFRRKMASNTSSTSGSGAGADGGISGADSNAVVKMGMVDGDFNPRMQKGDLTFVKFSAPWCSRCKSLAPEWAQLSDNFAGKVTIAEVDCTHNQKLCERYKIDGYPTLILFKDGKPTQEYRGGRNVKMLTKFLEQNM